jgi:HrpA-like RNA helicase
MDWASKRKQRAERAGRVSKRFSYSYWKRRHYIITVSHRLCTVRSWLSIGVQRVYADVHEKHMEEQSMPKILRCPLENVVLKAKILDMGPPQGNLAAKT